VRADDPFVVAAATLAAALFISAWVIVLDGVDPQREIVDTPVYQFYGDSVVVHGQVPYRDFALEYPPGALPAFLVPKLIEPEDSPDGYKRAFGWTMAFCGSAIVLLTVAALLALEARPARFAGVLAFASLWPLALGPVELTRFDLWPSALALGALASFLAGRDRLGAGVLGAAVAAKLYPAVLLPLAAVWVWRRGGRRALAVCGGIFAAVLLAVFLPFFVVSPGGVADSLGRQLSRPLQIESLGAAVLVQLHNAFGLDVGIESSHGSQNVAGSLGTGVAGVTTGLQLAALVAVWIAFGRGPANAERLVRYSALALVVFVAFGKVLSPQFMIWLVPFVPLVAGRRGLAASALLALALFLTRHWFPNHYWDYVLHFDGELTWTVLGRDFALVALAGVLAAPTGWARAPARTSAPVRPDRTRPALPRS
jgi:glycosyl transferase family 87